MNKIILFFFTALLLTSTASAACFTYFYGQNCPSCAQTTAYIEQYSPSSVKEVFFIPENALLLQQYYGAYNVPPESRGLPAVFFADTYLIGKKPILTLSQEHMDDETCPSTTLGAVVGVVGKNFPLNVLQEYSFIRISWGALKEGFHPGALLLLFVMLAFIIPLRERIIRRSLFFLGGVIIVYAFFIAGRFSSLATSPAQVLVQKILAGIAIIYGIIALGKFFWRWRFFHFEDQQKDNFEYFISVLISSPAMLAWGLLFSLLSFNKVSSTLLSVRAFNNGWNNLLLLGYYLLVLCLPMIIAIILLYTTRDKMDFKAEKEIAFRIPIHKRHHQRVLEVVVGIIAFLIGIIALIW